MKEQKKETLGKSFLPFKYIIKSLKKQVEVMT
jgi:hypothetical protein